MARYLHQLLVRPAVAQPLRRSRRPQAVPFSGRVVRLGPLGSAGLAVVAVGHQVRASVDENKVVVLGRIDEGWNKRYMATLAWSALITTILVLALLLQALAAAALVVPGPVAPPAACLSSADATLADADDVQARFPTDVCGGPIGTTPVSCSVPATEGKACIS